MTRALGSRKMNEYSFIFYGIIDHKMGSTAAVGGRRAASREKRRQQLIDATMKCIARKGMSSTTLGDVASEAGLSQGIVNLHFKSKDNLLNETLRALADDYKSQFDKTIDRAGPAPANRLLAAMELDFKPSICDRKKLALWFAFWGEAKARPAYRKICYESDRYYDEVVEHLCARIIEDGGYRDVKATAAANALTSMTNGLWQWALISPHSFNRDKAMEAVMSYLRSVFPEHFE